MLKKIFVTLFTLNVFQLIQAQEIISETRLKGTNQKITYQYINDEAIFTHHNGTETKILSKIKIQNPLKTLKKGDYYIDINKNVCKVTNTIKSINNGLVSFFEMSIMLFFPVMVVADVVIALAYPVAYPLDLFSDDNRAYRKIKKLMKGKSSQASAKVFQKMLEATSALKTWTLDDIYRDFPYCDQFAH